MQRVGVGKALVCRCMQVRKAKRGTSGFARKMSADAAPKLRARLVVRFFSDDAFLEHAADRHSGRLGLFHEPAKRKKSAHDEDQCSQIDRAKMGNPIMVELPREVHRKRNNQANHRRHHGREPLPTSRRAAHHTSTAP